MDYWAGGKKRYLFLPLLIVTVLASGEREERRPEIWEAAAEKTHFALARLVSVKGRRKRGKGDVGQLFSALGVYNHVYI